MRICRRCGGLACLYWLCRPDVLALAAVLCFLVVADAGGPWHGCWTWATQSQPVIVMECA